MNREFIEVLLIAASGVASVGLTWLLAATRGKRARTKQEAAIQDKVVEIHFGAAAGTKSTADTERKKATVALVSSFEKPSATREARK
jgi:hypothetical protein